MTYKEFRKWCKDNKYAVLESEKYIGVIDEELTTLCGVSKGSEMVCDIRTGSRKLIDKALALALTPLEERESQKKYYVVVKGDAFRLCANKRRNNGYLFISDEEENEDYQTKFTKQEAEEIMKRLSIEMEEVEG